MTQRDTVNLPIHYVADVSLARCTVYTVLSTRRLSFDSSQDELVRLAVADEFDGVEPVLTSFTADPSEADRVAELAKNAGLRWGPASLPETLGPETSRVRFTAMLELVQRAAPRLRQAGVTTLAIWVRPAHDEFTFDEATSFYRRRLNEFSPVLSSHGLRLALEYVGPSTWRRGYRYDFVHSLAGVRELLEKAGEPDAFGVVLDTFHWYTAGESTADIGDARDVLAVDLNDAVPDVPRDEQLDLERAQPGATGVIDVDAFLAALRAAKYAGPVHSEPFSTALDHQPPIQRVRESRRALRAALAPPEIRRHLTGSTRVR